MNDLISKLIGNNSLDKKELLLIGGGVLGVGIPLLGLVGYMFSGATHSPFSFIYGKPKYLIKGEVSPGYEQVTQPSFFPSDLLTFWNDNL